MRSTTIFKSASLVILVCAILGAGWAQESPTIAVRAGRLIDVRSGKVSTNAYILVAKDRILRILILLLLASALLISPNTP